MVTLQTNIPFTVNNPLYRVVCPLLFCRQQSPFPLGRIQVTFQTAISFTVGVGKWLLCIQQSPLSGGWTVVALQTNCPLSLVWTVITLQTITPLPRRWPQATLQTIISFIVGLGSSYSAENNTLYRGVGQWLHCQKQSYLPFGWTLVILQTTIPFTVGLDSSFSADNNTQYCGVGKWLLCREQSPLQCCWTGYSADKIPLYREVGVWLLC